MFKLEATIIKNVCILNNNMPYKSEKIKLPKELDRRIKLTKTDKEEIKELYFIARISLRGLARLFKVDKKTIKFVIFPDFYEKEKDKQRKDKHWQKYYLKATHTKAIREHRQYKQKLYINGLLQKGGEKI
jgi:hypothetical protein